MLSRILCSSLFVLALFGGTSFAAPRATATTHAVVGDTQIESQIRTKLAKSKIGKDGFRFKVAHGVVTWEGTTAVPQHKGSATRMAKAAGAKEVVNNIKVTGSGKSESAAPVKKAAVSEE